MSQLKHWSGTNRCQVAHCICAHVVHSPFDIFIDHGFCPIGLIDDVRTKDITSILGENGSFPVSTVGHNFSRPASTVS